MLYQMLNWRTGLAVIAIMIVTGTIFYTQYLARKIAKEEKQKVEQWVEASNTLLNPDDSIHTGLAFKIIQDNDDIPIIVTNEKDSIIEHKNLDSTRLSDTSYLLRMLRKLKSINEPIVWEVPVIAGEAPSLPDKKFNLYYYGHTRILNEIKYFPFVQLFVVGLFIIVTILALRSNYRSTQNQVWAGMAKETAHQLGTPVSSLEGWAEVMKERFSDDQFIKELGKDIDRLRLVTDRFGKIGSKPQLAPTNLIKQITEMVDYIKRRASEKVYFSINSNQNKEYIANLSAPLFDWVIENLLKNSLDAIEGKGNINIEISESDNMIFIDIIDSGKGIARQNINNVFKPGFTTKKRGWGLGLSLSKRIIEQYHKGKIFVKSSEQGSGTTFRIILKK